MFENDDILFDKREPSDEDLKRIESEYINDSLLVDDLDISINLTDKELDIINEMVKIIEDPNYVSEARKKRLEKESDEYEAAEKDFGINFDDMSMNTYDSFDEDY